MSLIGPEAQLSVVDVDKVFEHVMRSLAALPEILTKNVGEVGQVLDSHHSVGLYGHLVEDEVVPVLNRTNHSLLHLLLDITFYFSVASSKGSSEQLQASKIMVNRIQYPERDELSTPT